jgi:hypothetical protein
MPEKCPWTVVTIGTRNYLHFPRTLAASVRQVHPEADVVLCLVDAPPTGWDSSLEPFKVVFADKLGIQNWNKFLFQYTPFELCCALKPFFLNYIFRTTDTKKVLYFDGDVFVCGRLDELLDKLDSATIILTPHLTSPISVTAPNRREIESLKTGAFNAGFIGARNTEITISMLDWWQTRTRHWCKWKINHHDQGWLDAVPALFDGVAIERGAQYNVAVWNTGNRDFSEDSLGRVNVNGRPLAFFHFAALEPDKPDSLSRIAWRNYDQEPTSVRRLHKEYLAKLEAYGMAHCQAWGYQYDRLADGTTIKEEWRELVRNFNPDLGNAINPFSLMAHDLEMLVQAERERKSRARDRRMADRRINKGRNTHLLNTAS